MRYLVSGTQMKQIDTHAIKEIGIPSMVLMERAAMAVAEVVESCADKSDSIWSVCGNGNNGADGIAAARMLFQKGYQVCIILCGDIENGTKEYEQQLYIARQLDISIIEYHDFISGACDKLSAERSEGDLPIIIDAIFGVGLSRNIEGQYKKVLEILQKQQAKDVIAIDIPSGIHSDTGQVMGTALKATTTVTFGYEKIGTVLYPGKAYSGTVIVKDIGFPEVSFQQAKAEVFTYEEADLCRIPDRPAYTNKGSFGKVLLVAGSKNMSGAAYLSALAAYRMGAGLVKILTPESNRVILQEQLPEAIIVTYNPEEMDANIGKSPSLRSAESIAFLQIVEEACEWASVIVLGPGLGQEPYVKTLVQYVLINAYVPIVIDADGLNTIAAYPALTGYYTENIIITPHLGEMARLTGKEISWIQEHLIETATQYCDCYGITCVLKDVVTVVADRENEVYLNTSGNSSMAKAGAGDVLTGTIAGLLALGEEIWEAAILGVYLHGVSGERCKEDMGRHGVLARDIANKLGRL